VSAQFLGRRADEPMGEITKQDVVAFRDALIRQVFGRPRGVGEGDGSSARDLKVRLRRHRSFGLDAQGWPFVFLYKPDRQASKRLLITGLHDLPLNRFHDIARAISILHSFLAMPFVAHS
jgi:hypothetical protein